MLCVEEVLGGFFLAFSKIRSTAHYFILIPTIVRYKNLKVSGYLPFRSRTLDANDVYVRKMLCSEYERPVR